MIRLPLADLARKPFDVLVIGAGINGAGAAQDMATRGFHVLCIDKGDFSSGATNRSSRILHCGLRHLTPGKSVWSFARHPSRFLLACINARKSMVSRSQIAETMPDLVRPFRFCFPLFDDDPYAPWQLDIAFKLLEKLGPGDLPLDYRRYTSKNMDEVPFSKWMRDPDKIKGFAVFRDYQFLSPERLVVDTLKDADRMGAVVRNYTECLSARRVGEFWEVELQESDGSGERITIKCKVVLNASGPWGDQLTQRLTGKSKQRMVGLKGIHILATLPKELTDWGMMAINSENETLYCLPWRGMHYIGPTRTPYSGNLNSVVSSEKEVNWMISEINRVMPKLNLTRQSVHYTYAGIQPVSFDSNDAKGTRQIRIHDLGQDGFPNMLMLTGGPIMTYRLIGSDLGDAVAKRIRPSGSAQKCCYGSSKITEAIQSEDKNGMAKRLSTDLLKQIIEEEQVINLSDLLFQRSNLGWNLDQGRANRDMTADIMAKTLNWDDERKQKQIRNYTRYIEATYPSYKKDL